MRGKRMYLKVLLAVMLAAALALGGCSDGDDGARGPEGPQGPAGESADAQVLGVNSPLGGTCYSCHQHAESQFFDAIRAHIDNLGGEMYGESSHGAIHEEGCASCHGGLRNGTTYLGRFPDLDAGEMHGADRISLAINGTGRFDTGPAAIEAVIIGLDGELDVRFSLHGTLAYVPAEFTISKWVEAEGSHISLLQRYTGSNTAESARVIRADNIRVQDDSLTRDGDVTAGRSFFRYQITADTDSFPVWRAGHNDAATICAGSTDTNCVATVTSLLTRINTNATWGEGTYRIGVTGRNRTTQGFGYTRFAAIADFEVDALGAISLVMNDATPAVATTLPTNQIEQASCTSCHGDRLAFPRNNVHGQQRSDVAVCFSCHNDYTFDAGGSRAGNWASLSMTNMIHKIHGGFEGYTADGYRYEDVAYPDWTFGTPGTTQNCVSCHNSEAEVQFGAGWDYAVPSAFGGQSDLGANVVCFSCHSNDKYGFDLTDDSAHGAAFGFTANCNACHSQTADQIHGVTSRLADLEAQRTNYSFSLVSIADAVYQGTPVVEWQVLDAAGTPYNLKTDISVHAGPRIHIGWGVNDDWTNEGSGEKSTFGGRAETDGGRPVALNVATTGASANTVISADGLTATTTFPAFTNEEAGKGKPYANLEAASEFRRGFVAFHRRVADGDKTRMLTSLVQPITLGFGENWLEEPRRNTVNATTEAGRGGSCLSCHSTISWHGSGYTADNNIQACVVCHNAGSHKATALVDPPYSVDMMELMHKIHSDPYTTTTTAGVTTKVSGTMYPRHVAGRCHACHTGSDSLNGVSININSSFTEQTNCTLCHQGVNNPGRIGNLSNWPGAFDNFGLRGDGTDGVTPE